MTAFSTRCCKKLNALVAFAACLLCLFFASSSHADGIELRNAALVAGDEGYFLEADFEIVLNPTLEDALNKGVPLYFLLEFELIRPRWYWFSEKVTQHATTISSGIQRADAPVSSRGRLAVPEFWIARGGSRFSVARAAPSGARAGDPCEG